jgi:hypothetical protein
MVEPLYPLIRYAVGHLLRGCQRMDSGQGYNSEEVKGMVGHPGLC